MLSIHLILIGIPSSLILFVNQRGWSEGGGGRVLLMDQGRDGVRYEGKEEDSIFW